MGKSIPHKRKRSVFLRTALCRSRVSHCLLYVVLCLPVAFAHAAAGIDSAAAEDSVPSGSAKKIVSIQPVLGEKGFTLHITADGKFEDYSSFRTTEPHGVVIELPNVQSARRSLWFFDNPLVKNIQVQTTSEDKVRIVFELFPIADLPYKVFSQGKRLTVTFGAATALATTEPARKLQKAPAASISAEQKSVPTSQAKRTPVKPATTITSVELKTVDRGVNVRILADGTLSRYHAFQLSDPARLVVDLTGVQSELGKQTLPSHDPLVKRVRSATFSKDTIRIVIDVGPPDVPPYQIIPGEDGLVVAMKRPSVAPVLKSASDTPSAPRPRVAKEGKTSTLTKKTPEKPSPAAPPGRILLHVGSFTHKGNARKEVQRLVKYGYTSFFAERTVSGQTWFRVYIGHFKDKQEALQKGLEFKEKGLISYFKVIIDRDIARTALTPIK